ncbi:hypothetical protein AC579_10349 [Pseudocercospora musae]|uniref:Heterokaryon incompatibility domain-containing protein n=1 Tax=Pseudocercospora musae TaxID=113226 RepID=A0A139ICT4_9PEZI|nr:hypothetical protein AC579_10349 [Pseudocercospora musae]
MGLPSCMRRTTQIRMSRNGLPRHAASYQAVGRIMGTHPCLAESCSQSKETEEWSSDTQLDSSLLQKVVGGIVTAVNISENEANQVLALVAKDHRSQTARQWHADMDSGFQQSNANPRQIANLAVAIALMITKSRRRENASKSELAFVWNLVCNAMQNQAMHRAGLSVNRSAQGFLAIPLCSVIKDGNIDILFRVHVWLPDGQRGAPGFDIHSHQPFAQSWVLAGQGTDYAYDVKPVATFDDATHARYALAWTSGANLDSKYKTHQTYSKVVNTGDFMRADIGRVASHGRDMSYSISAGSFHSSKVAPDGLHATLFLFDGSQGFVRDAPVLGPAEAEEHVQIRDAAGITSSALSGLVDSVRRWEDCLLKSQYHAQRAEWLQGFSALKEAQSLCEADMDLAHMAKYRQAVIDRLRILLQSHALSDSEEVVEWRYLYGRALLLNGDCEDALAQFNHFDGTTPAIAFSRVPSEQNRERLRYLTTAGADFERVDRHGCSALDYAIMNSDFAAEKIIVTALRDRLEQRASGEIHQRLREARLRKHFREIFREILRPMLIGGEVESMTKVRSAYSEVLLRDPAKYRAFDAFKYVKYSELLEHGRFPRSNAGLAQSYRPGHSAENYFLFFSYRWVNPDPWAQEPDDEENTQYKRVLQAIAQFLTVHPHIEPEKIGVWIDFACIDQEHPECGIAALPLLLAQCDAVISLVDDRYYDRAWCSVEVMMIHTLRKAYGVHQWYEFAVPAPGSVDCAASPLRAGPECVQVALTSKLLRYEEDRPKILFLERQSKLLC